MKLIYKKIKTCKDNEIKNLKVIIRIHHNFINF